MTRLDYMRLTPGQRKDVREHLKASGYGLDGIPATFGEFLAPYVGGRRASIGGMDGTVRSQNHHGIDADSLKRGFIVREAESGSGYSNRGWHKKDNTLQHLFKPRRAGE